MDTSDEQVPVFTRLAEVCDLLDRCDPVFVRFSQGPAADRDRTSVDYESGLDLPGLSVNTLVPEPWWDRPRRDWVARRLCSYAHLGDEEERFAWLLTGEVVARGPDNEPLVASWRPLAILDETVVDEAQALYQERFDVGRDSRG